MKKKLFVGNLSWKATEESLKPVFEEFGKVVSIKIITDHTGRSKGFGFVEYENADDAESAIKNLNEKLHLDRNIRVSFAQERTERPAGERREYRGGNSGGGQGYGGSRGGHRSRDNAQW